MNLVRVTPVVSQTSSNTGALVLVSIVSGSANRVVVVVVVDWEMEVDSFDGAKAAPELMVGNNARNESFMVTRKRNYKDIISRLSSQYVE